MQLPLTDPAVLCEQKVPAPQAVASSHTGSQSRSVLSHDSGNAHVLP